MGLVPMAGAETLIAESADEAVEAGTCPRCGEPWGDLPAVPTSLFDGATLRRCARCGMRHTAGEPPLRRVFICVDCDMPFLAETTMTVEEDDRCSDCETGRFPDNLTDPAVSSAVEAEIRLGLEQTWHLLRSSHSGSYLQRILTAAGRRLPGSPVATAARIVDDDAVRTLALPSGALLLSRGTLRFLADEAELVFVIAHELAHIASKDAADRLARFGLLTVTRGGGREWRGAGLDLLRLGYGRRRELEADAQAIRVMLDLGYETASATRFLERLAAAAARGDEGVAEYAVAHPGPAERIRQIESLRRSRLDLRGNLRVNREVFRRAAGPDVLEAELERLDGWDGVPAPSSPRSSVPTRTGLLLLLALALLLLLIVR